MEDYLHFPGMENFKFVKFEYRVSHSQAGEQDVQVEDEDADHGTSEAPDEVLLEPANLLLLIVADAAVSAIDLFLTV